MEGLRIVTATLAVTGRHLHHRQVGVQLQRISRERGQLSSSVASPRGDDVQQGPLGTLHLLNRAALFRRRDESLKRVLRKRTPMMSSIQIDVETF